MLFYISIEIIKEIFSNRYSAVSFVFFIPIFFLVGFKKPSVAIGTIILGVLLHILGFLSVLPEGKGGNLGGIMLLFGIIIAFIFCLLVYYVKKWVKKVLDS